jgi:hypothetical protein
VSNLTFARFVPKTLTAQAEVASSENTLTAGRNAFVFCGRSPQWVRFFE